MKRIRLDSGLLPSSSWDRTEVLFTSALPGCRASRSLASEGRVSKTFRHDSTQLFLENNLTIRPLLASASFLGKREKSAKSSVCSEDMVDSVKP